MCARTDLTLFCYPLGAQAEFTSWVLHRRWTNNQESREIFFPWDSKGPSYLHVKAESPAGSAWHSALRWTEEDRRERRRKEEAASSKSHSLQTPSQSLGYKPTRCLTLCGRLHNRVVLRFSCQPRRTRITHRVGYFCARFGPYFSQHHSSTCIIIFAIELLQLFRSSVCWPEPDRRAKTRT